MATLSFPADTYDELVTRMNGRPEEVAFMLAGETSDEGAFRISDLRFVDGHRFAHRSDDHAEPDDEIRGEMIRWAWESGDCLVEAHSHGAIFVPACFSRFDFSQFEDWVPHVRWRLRRQPYLALVIAGDQVDGLAWIGANAETIDRIEVDGRDDVATTGASFAYLEARCGR
jgi:hypothetical protein